MNITGMGKNAKTIENSLGAKQSDVPLALHLVDPEFFKELFRHAKPSTALNTMKLIYTYMSSKNTTMLYIALHYLEMSKYELLFAIGNVLKEGAKKYSPNNWRNIPREEHLNHALNHLYAEMVGDEQDEHIEHAMCRLMMATATRESEGFDYTSCKEGKLEGLWHSAKDGLFIR